MPSGARNSSARITPGWLGMRFSGITASLLSVVVGETYLVGVVALPAEDQPPLVVDADRVTR
jgi:hypothetical protein